MKNTPKNFLNIPFGFCKYALFCVYIHILYTRTFKDSFLLPIFTRPRRRVPCVCVQLTVQEYEKINLNEKF